LAARFVMVDRDGVINRRVRNGYVTTWRQFIFLPGVLDGLRRLTEAGYSIIVISNQAGVGKGAMNTSDLDRITRRFIRKVQACGGVIRRAYYCTHPKTDRCPCRKPRPGLLLTAQQDYKFVLADTYFIGDATSDLIAASRAGCPMIMVAKNKMRLANDRWPIPPRAIVADFPAAVNFVLHTA
jgi:D-glycero-D-manno-heptose 1,7-bisphosphate phosphatase